MPCVSGQSSELIGVSHSYYIAAPFFNPVQLELVRRIEQVFENCEVTAFSPRLQHGEKPTPILSREMASKAFGENFVAIERCSHMVAVVDWLMPSNQELRVVSSYEGDMSMPHPHMFEGVSPALNLPDAGTVWEMGAAYALRKPVLMLTLRPKGDKINIMLSESCFGLVRGPEMLRAYLCGSQSAVESWEGRYT